ncbi:MAG: hypothetical protein DHS20C18_03200 [Saprospiraceae bacterium]|nr:MAG: hypothetical protein DHS20C18_03200 [Saprospiraceae bacterium]
MTTTPQIIRVYEHQTIRVGETIDDHVFKYQHFLALVEYASGKSTKYYKISHQAVRFQQYVGAIQIGDLLIEILPKADRHKNVDSSLWQHFLLDLLWQSRWLNADYPGPASIDLVKDSVLNYIIDHYLWELEELLKNGLTGAYSLRRKNVNALKGRLLFREHLRKNQIHRERFFTEHQVFDFDHLLNQVLYKALQLLSTLTLNPALHQKIRKLQHLFPPCSDIGVVNERLFNKLMGDRRNLPYQSALLLARMFLLNYRPGIKGGKYPLLGILFDMNLLWEHYIYQQLFRLEKKDVKVTRQSRRPFWDRRYLQADLVLTTATSRIILDTKWKILSNPEPSMNDLRQMFVYAQFFDADQTVLLYPKAGKEKDFGPIDFALDKTKPGVSCRLCFVNPIKDGRLNTNLGEDLLVTLLP